MYVNLKGMYKMKVSYLEFQKSIAHILTHYVVEIMKSLQNCRLSYFEELTDCIQENDY